MKFTRWLVPLAAAAQLALSATAARAQASQQGAPGKNNGSAAAPATATANLRAGYAGSEACMECHKKDVKQFSESPMGKVMLSHPRTEHEKAGCETCHGPGKEHAESGGEERGALVTFGRKSPTSVADRNAVCLSCHQKTARMWWTGSTHESRNVACTDCHSVMHGQTERSNLKKEGVIETCGQCHPQQRNASMRSTHMPMGEKKMECTSCHNPHGSANPKLLLASSVNESCYSCHAEKRGPFLWEHAPVVENCANCHDPHGSSHEKMLKVSRPRLCQQCHAGGTGHPAAARSAAGIRVNSTGGVVSDVYALFNRQCSNCHVNIHGSNHPGGSAFTR
ncbi:MAG TPA: DmsE family decaheme c-type cytochrome [Gemmatimonadaceae bacterium]